MRYLIIFAMFLLSSMSFAELIVTSEDVEIRFPEAADPDGSWHTIDITNVGYFQEPVGTHEPKARLQQTWEGLLQADDPDAGKVRFDIDVIALPYVSGSNRRAREMHLHFRVRELRDGTLYAISSFSEWNMVTIIGDPGKPVHIGMAPAKIAEFVETALLQNYPNGCNPETWIPYRLAIDSDVIIRIYNSSGSLIRTLDVGCRPADCYIAKDKAIYWDGKNELGDLAASGIYFYNLQAGDFSASRKMVIVN